MTFSSLVFLCIFLPVVYVLHTIVPSIRVRNALLIVASLLFYAFGEPVYVLLMIASALMNYLFALWIGSGQKRAAGASSEVKTEEPAVTPAATSQNASSKGRLALVLAVVFNIGILCVFKYTAFLLNTLNGLTGLSIPVPAITLPIGISFFTFQALSYVIDVYRGQTGVQKSFFKVLLYISFFPQLIAGPIVKYKDIEAEINQRSVSTEETAAGLVRFITGLAKKVLIANAMAVAADACFNAEVSSLNLLAAWIGAIAYTLQIYFDFSGYSDMAIGLGRMFGFHFRENFLQPYQSSSIKEFWRRWHVSLSSWFKDYVYIPLGGNRKGRIRTGVNKVLVFFLTGLWHGANWTFVVWGLFHGAFSFLEELVPALRRLPKVIAHIYTMLVVTIGFVIFRADTLDQGLTFIGRMFGGFDFSAEPMAFALRQLNPYFLVMLAAAVIVCALPKKLRFLDGEAKTAPVYVVCLALLCWCILRLSGGSYNPFIYFRF